MSIVWSAEVEYVTNLSTKTEDRDVVDFEQDQYSPQKNKKIKTGTSQSEEFEFIIGGQSTDGVAKRSQLKIIK